MNILIIGCGKVGSRLANVLDNQGHDVAIVDVSAESFELLDASFSGYSIVGMPIDQDVLQQAGIEGCDAVVAVTKEDNVNIMVSQMAEKIFNINNIITRIYDPHRENTFSKFGLTTVCPTNFTVDAISSVLNYEKERRYLHFSNSTVSFSISEVPKSYIGKNINYLNEDNNENEMIFGVIRDGNKIFLSNQCNFKLKETDELILSRIID